MATNSELVLYHIPQSRYSTALWMLEELGRPDRIHQLDFNAGEQRSEAFLRINPAGKVPVLVDGDMVISERAAVCLYLADRYAPGTLAPATDHRDRGDYLKWMFYSAGVMEPILGLTMLKVEIDAPRESLGWGDRDTMIGIVSKHLANREFFVGERFSAADVVAGGMLVWALAAGIFPDRPSVSDYVARMRARPALQRAFAKDGVR